MRLEIGIYSLLLAAGLGLAYWASLPTLDGVDDGKVALLSLEPSAITSLVFASKDGQVKAERRSSDQRFWLEQQKIEKVEVKKAAATHTAQATATSLASAAATATATTVAQSTATATGTEVDAQAEASEKITTEKFLGNEKIDDVLKMFNPLRALRVIGKVDGDKLAEFGLKDSKDQLTVKSGAQTLTLLLGRKGYGSQSRFALELDSDGKPGRVILIESQALENLEKASIRLYERRLVAFEMEEVQKVEIKALGQTKSLSAIQRDKDGQPQFSDDEGGAINASYGSWLDKVSKLRLVSYVDDKIEAELAGVNAFMSISFRKGDKVLDTVEFKKTSGSGDKPEFYATSAALKLHVRLPSAKLEPIEKDLPQIVKAKEDGGASSDSEGSQP